MENRNLSALLARIAPPDRPAGEEARRRLDDKTKPRGSLGRIEELAIRLAAIRRGVDFETRPRAVVIFAADHGVVARGVSAYPAEVTAQMVHNFASGGAAINVLARQMEAATVIVDMGVAGNPRWPSAVRSLRLGPGTGDMTREPAMTREQAARGIGHGAALAAELAGQGTRVLVTGEMGIGSSTAAAALTAVFCDRPVREVTGAGTGLAEDGVLRKIAALEEALALHRPRREDPLGTLACVGGFEIAAIAGLILGAAAERLPVLLDGFIAGAGALVAAAFSPVSVGYMIAGHRSAEPGHAAALAALGLSPLLDLDLRLGEGTGAVLALPLLDAARAILDEMASFESAGVSRRREN